MGDKILSYASQLAPKLSYWSQRWKKVFATNTYPSLDLNKNESDVLYSLDNQRMEDRAKKIKLTDFSLEDALFIQELATLNPRKLYTMNAIQSTIENSEKIVKNIMKENNIQDNYDIRNYVDLGKKTYNKLKSNLLEGGWELQNLGELKDYLISNLNKKELSKKKKVLANKGIGKLDGFLNWYAGKNLWQFGRNDETNKILFNDHKEHIRQNELNVLFDYVDNNSLESEKGIPKQMFN